MIADAPAARLAVAAGALVLAFTGLASAWPSDVLPSTRGTSAAIGPPPVPDTASAPGTPEPRVPPGPGSLDPDDFVPLPELGPTFDLTAEGEDLTGPPSLANVDGIVVHERLAPFLRTLLDEAEVAGVALEGGGYRDAASQRRLRAKNCPDPERSPAAACSPPTAKVGESLHEYGLAVDFTSGGTLILERGSPAYRFLAANSRWSGLEPHPQEPWHWSYRP